MDRFCRLRGWKALALGAARRGDLLVISSDAGELKRVLKLEADGGKGSLGQSAELRYLLSNLPLRDSTKGFIYPATTEEAAAYRQYV